MNSGVGETFCGYSAVCNNDLVTIIRRADGKLVWISKALYAITKQAKHECMLRWMEFVSFETGAMLRDWINSGSTTPVTVKKFCKIDNHCDGWWQWTFAATPIDEEHSMVICRPRETPCGRKVTDVPRSCIIRTATGGNTGMAPQKPQ